MEFKSIQKEVAPRETKSQTITYRVTPSLKSALREYASAKGVSLQDVIQLLLTMLRTNLINRSKCAMSLIQQIINESFLTLCYNR